MTWPTKDDFIDGDILTAAQVNNIADNLNLFDPTSATAGQVPVADGAGSISYGAVPAGVSVVTPSTVVATGGGSSATINAGGSVSFTTCATLSLNDVFVASYSNYLVVCRLTTSATSTDIYARLRLAGTDASGASDYVNQYLTASSSSVGAGRITAFTQGWLSQSYAVQRTGFSAYFYGPDLAQPTAVRSSGASDESSARIFEAVWTHDLSTAYDGLTIYTSTGSMTGLVTVYGLGQ
jgi:hypothetical protein